jgi:hypothetical protein
MLKESQTKEKLKMSDEFAYMITAISDGYSFNITSGMDGYGDAAIIAMNVSNLPSIDEVTLESFRHPHINIRTIDRIYRKGHAIQPFN